MSHLSDNAIEQIATNSTPSFKMDRIEEHLLLCPSCLPLLLAPIMQAIRLAALKFERVIRSGAVQRVGLACKRSTHKSASVAMSNKRQRVVTDRITNVTSATPLM